MSQYEKKGRLQFSMPQENAVLQKVLKTENQWKEMFQPAVSFSAQGNDKKIYNANDSVYTPNIADFLPAFSSLSRPSTETQTIKNTKEQKYENTSFQSQTKTDQAFPKKLQFDTAFLEEAMRGAIRQGVQSVPFQNITRESEHTEWRTTRQSQTQSQKYDSVSFLQKENTPFFISRPGGTTTENLSPVRFPVQTDLSVKLQNQSASSDGNIKATISQVKNNIEKEVRKQDVRGKIFTSFEIEQKQDFSNQIQNAIIDVPELDQIEKTVDIAVTGKPEIKNSADISFLDFGIPETKNESVTLLLEGNKEIVNQLNVMAEEFGIAPSVMQTIAVQLLGKALPQQTEKPQAASFGIPSEIAQMIGINLTGQKNILNSVSVSANDFGVPSSIYQSVAVHLTPYVTTGGASLGSLRKARGGIVGKNGAIGFADGGMVRGGPQLITVAEEGTPEMIIPLGSQRKQRAVQLWEKTGHILGVPGFANGGIISPSGHTEKTFVSNKINNFNQKSSSIYAPVITDNIHFIDAPIKKLFTNIAETFAAYTADCFTEQSFSTPAPNKFSLVNKQIQEVFKNISENIAPHTENSSVEQNLSIGASTNFSQVTEQIDEVLKNMSESIASRMENSFAEQNLSIGASNSFSQIAAQIEKDLKNISENIAMYIGNFVIGKNFPIASPRSFSPIDGKIKEPYDNISKNIANYSGNVSIGKSRLVYAQSSQDSFPSICEKIQSFFESIQTMSKIVSENQNTENMISFETPVDIEKYFGSQTLKEKQDQYFLSQKSEEYYPAVANAEKILCSANAATALQKNTGEKTFQTETKKFLLSESQNQKENKNIIFFPATQEKIFSSPQTISQNERTFSRITPTIAQNQTNAPLSVTIGNITFQIEMNGENNDLLSSIEAQKEKIADCIAQVIGQTLQEKFENTPLRGGQTA